MRTLNDFYEVEGNSLISNNFNAFDTDILEIRIQTLYGNRPLRPFTDSRIKLISQNVVNMWSGYLSELFTLPEEYNILIPELKEFTRKMSYTKTNDDVRDITGSENGTSHGTSTSSGSDNRVVDNKSSTIYGKKTDTTANSTTSDNGTDSYVDTTTKGGTAETVTSGDTNGTLNKNVSAYNQSEGFTPREQEISSGNNAGTSTLTNDLEDKTNHNGQYSKDGTSNDTSNTSESGTDEIIGNTKDNLTKSDRTESDGNTSKTSSSNDKFTGAENYQLDEQTKETGRLSYEEIMQTIEKLFNPYDWLAEKIVASICEQFYAGRIRNGL